MEVPITALVMIGVVLIAYFYLRYRARAEVQQTVRLAIEHGKELSPELLDSLSSEAVPGARGDLRKGVLWLALAAAIGLMSWVLGESDLLGIGSLPLMLGIAYLALWCFAPDRTA